jgi:hypothetical protein
MYDNPGPVAKRSDRAATFEEHLQLIYLDQGFILGKRECKQVFILIIIQ